MIVVGIILAVLLVVLAVYICLFRSISRKDALCERAWEAVDEQIALRTSLIPQLVEALKNNPHIDANDLKHLSTQCKKVESAKATKERIASCAELSTCIGTFFAKYTNHSSDLPSDELRLWQDKFSDLDLSFGIARSQYNECVQTYNNAITSFPGKFVAWSRFRVREGFNAVDETAEFLAA